ncbi:MAG: hypothetical protein MEQ07_08935 [Aquimonas sp.]|nr:hypothetical protein [Aquimonas sp.]
MDSLYPLLVSLHGLAGVLALLSFWVAAFARKGARPHVLAGRAYLLAMLAIVLTAVPMSLNFFVRGQTGTGTFLAYLGVITASSMWLGLRAVRLKRSPERFLNRAYVGVALLNLACGGVVLALGLQRGLTLLIGFSLVGLLLGAGMLRRYRGGLEAGPWWLREHFSAMLGCAAATHVAFLSIGLNSVVRAAGGGALPPQFGLLAWVLPVVAVTVAGVWLDRRYRAGTLLRRTG